MSGVMYCRNCLFPATKPDLFFDDQGICDACRSAERKHGVVNSIDWDEREQAFNALVTEAKATAKGPYDCIVPVSGGKDSTWQAYAMKKKHGMNPLAVTFDQFDQTDVGRYNLDVLRSIGVDHIHFTLNPNVVRSLVKKGLEIVGDPYWVNHVGMFSVPFQFAVKFGIPLVMFGEHPQFEYGGPALSRDNMKVDRRWRQEFGLMRGFREEDMVDNEITARDLAILAFPSDAEMSAAGVLGTFYGHFFKWDACVHTEFIKSFGWKPLSQPPAGSWANFENCDMRFIDIREHIKYLKFGYGRATDQLNIEIRAGRMMRSEALAIVREIDGQVDETNINDFCQYVEISRADYNVIMDSFVNEEIFEKNARGKWVLRNERI